MSLFAATPALAPGQALYPHLLAPLDAKRAIDQAARLAARL
ncbi:hypothetical protein [Acidovorax soli]|nr:hypothetical protein [Acidovorax soli]